MKIRWDEDKAIANLRKHEVSLEEAESVFDDSLALTVNDDAHSLDEKDYNNRRIQNRAFDFGMSYNQ